MGAGDGVLKMIDTPLVLSAIRLLSGHIITIYVPFPSLQQAGWFVVARTYPLSLSMAQSHASVPCVLCAFPLPRLPLYIAAATAAIYAYSSITFYRIRMHPYSATGRTMITLYTLIKSPA